VCLTQAAFAELGEGFGLAEGALGMGISYAVISGTDARYGYAPYVNQIFLGSTGGPGAPQADGWPTYYLPVAASLMYHDSTEVDEQKYPLHVYEKRLIPDSEGAGRHRGALGSHVSYGPKGGTMTLAYTFEGHVHPARGVRGGLNAAPSDGWKIGADGERVDVPMATTLDIVPGERVVSRPAAAEATATRWSARPIACWTTSSRAGCRATARSPSTASSLSARRPCCASTSRPRGRSAPAGSARSMAPDVSEDILVEPTVEDADAAGDVDVGQRLRTVRQRKRHTLKTVADRAGISQSFLSQVERGRAATSIATLKRIAAALDISMGELFEPDMFTRPRVLKMPDRRRWRSAPSGASSC